MSLFESKKDSNEVFRIIVFLSPFIFLLFSAFLQILNLSFFQADDFKTQSESNRLYQSKIFPQRGFIYDSNNILLVENNIQQDLQINPNIIENPSLFLKQISDLLELNYSKIESDFFIRATGKNIISAVKEAGLFNLDEGDKLTYELETGENGKISAVKLSKA